MKLKKIKLIYTLMMGLTLILTHGCKKEDKDDSTTPTTSEYFIEGKVNNVLVSAGIPTTEAITANNYNDVTNTISMQRIFSDDNPKGWSIYIFDVEMDRWQVPDTLDASQPDGQVHIQMDYFSGFHATDNTYNVAPVALGNNSFQMIITSKSDDVIQGTFHGTLKNNSSSNLVVNVTEGRFKIKINRY